MDEISCRMEKRDVDLLLLEEFLASGSFRAWFLAQIGVEDPHELVTASRSVVTANGESDVEVELQGPKGKLLILIENKIGAVFQDRQADRYRERES